MTTLDEYKAAHEAQIQALLAGDAKGYCEAAGLDSRSREDFEEFLYEGLMYAAWNASAVADLSIFSRLPCCTACATMIARGDLDANADYWRSILDFSDVPDGPLNLTEANLRAISRVQIEARRIAAVRWPEESK